MLPISIIVPIYKAEQYLCRCIDSILAQTFQDFELLLIDDGSPDHSGVICDEYAKQDSRIRVFHQENSGVSSARQLGIDSALGEYTIHVDPDDWIDSDMLASLYAKAHEGGADMVICDYYEEYYHRTRYVAQLVNALDAESILRAILLCDLHGSLCNKLIRRSCYTAYNIRFPLDVSLWEDRYICCSMLLNNVKVVSVNKAYYHYDLYSNESSIVRTNHTKGINSQKRFIQFLQERLDPCLYVRELYTIKAEVKDKAFACSSYYKRDFILLYSEINERYRTDCTSPFSVRFYAALVIIFNNKNIPYFIYRILLIFRSLLRSTVRCSLKINNMLTDKNIQME